MELTSKLIKNIIGLDRALYETSRLYETKSGYKFKLSNVAKGVDILQITSLLQQSLDEYNVSYKIAKSIMGNDIVISLKYKHLPDLKNGLVDIRRIDDSHISEAAYYIAESRGFDGDYLAHWLDAEKQLLA